MESRASTTWEGDLMSGSGTTSLASGAAEPFAVTWSSRTEASEGRTSPEELIAAAHATCFSMAFSNGLAKAGTPPNRLDTAGNGHLREVRVGIQGHEERLDRSGRYPGDQRGRIPGRGGRGEGGMSGLTGPSGQRRDHPRGQPRLSSAELQSRPLASSKPAAPSPSHSRA